MRNLPGLQQEKCCAVHVERHLSILCCACSHAHHTTTASLHCPALSLQLADGIVVFRNVTGVKLNATVIGHLFRNFMQKVASPKVCASRPGCRVG